MLSTQRNTPTNVMPNMYMPKQTPTPHQLTLHQPLGLSCQFRRLRHRDISLVSDDLHGLFLFQHRTRHRRDGLLVFLRDLFRLRAQPTFFQRPVFQLCAVLLQNTVFSGTTTESSVNTSTTQHTNNCPTAALNDAVPSMIPTYDPN